MKSNSSVSQACWSDAFLSRETHTLSEGLVVSITLARPVHVLPGRLCPREPCELDYTTPARTKNVTKDRILDSIFDSSGRDPQEPLRHTRSQGHKFHAGLHGVRAKIGEKLLISIRGCESGEDCHNLSNIWRSKFHDLVVKLAKRLDGFFHSTNVGGRCLVSEGSVLLCLP